MKTLIVTAVLSLLTGCAGVGTHSSGSMGAGSSAGGSDYYQDDGFHSWRN